MDFSILTTVDSTQHTTTKMSNTFGRSNTNFGGLSDPNHWTTEAVAARAAQAQVTAQPTFGRALTEGYLTAGLRTEIREKAKK